jgi:hypothetical protein
MFMMAQLVRALIRDLVVWYLNPGNRSKWFAKSLLLKGVNR